MNTGDAKETILARIARAGVTSAAESDSPNPMTPARSRREIVDQFVEYAAEYKAHVVRVDAASLADAIEARLEELQAKSVVIPADLPTEWRHASRTYVIDEGLSHVDLDSIDAVITGCAVAVAETGTVVLDSGPTQGRRAISLIPDHHLCVVFEHQILDTVPEAVDCLSDSVHSGLPLTWISGPSATSDIELTRVEGVHGPRVLDIFVVTEALPEAGLA